MRSVIKYIILGLVQGIAEVLPISSSAHLLIVSDILGLSDGSLTFEIFLHLASLIAIVFFLRKKLWILIKGFCLYVFKKNKEYKIEFTYCIMLVISTIPIVIVTLFLKDYLEQFDSMIWLVGLLLIINGIALWIMPRIKGTRTKEDLNYVDALVIGATQCFGLFPGISRSGSCLYGAFARKIEKETAADYAFVLIIPAVLGATVLKLVSGDFSKIASDQWILYGISFIVALLATYFAFVFLLKIIKRGKIGYFSYYCVAIGLAVLIYGLCK